MRRSLGLEIGAAGYPLGTQAERGWIRWVELEEERGGNTIRAFGTVAFEAGERAAGESLRAVAAERRWRNREVVVSLPRSAVTLRWVSLPLASREETAGMVELEAVQSLPFPTEEAAWDFVSFRAPEGRQEVLMVAARRAQVQDLQRQIEAAGLRVAAVTVNGVATAALYRELLPEAEAGAVLLHLEGESVTLSCVQQGRLLLSRSVAPERRDAEALAVEIRRTLVAGTASAATARSGGPAPVAANAVWLTGEGASEALAGALQSVLGTEAREPGRTASGSSATGRGMKVGLLPRGRLPGGDALGPSRDPALGLALLGLRPAAERLDLARAVRGESRRQAAGPARRLPLLAGAGAAVLGMILLLQYGPGAGDRELAAAAARAQADARQLVAKRQQLEMQVRQLAGAVTPAHSYLDVLNEVSALAGSEAWLTQYSYERGRPIVIRGTARTNDAVARLVEGLRRSPHLERVALGSVTRAEADKSDPVSLVQFTITGSLQGDQALEARRSRPRSAARAPSPTRQEE